MTGVIKRTLSAATVGLALTWNALAEGQADTYSDSVENTIICNLWSICKDAVYWILSSPNDNGTRIVTLMLPDQTSCASKRVYTQNWELVPSLEMKPSVDDRITSCSVKSETMTDKEFFAEEAENLTRQEFHWNNQ